MICGGCGSETRRLHAVMTSNGGKTLLPEGERREVCPNCAPGEFQDPWSSPADRRVWLDHVANPDQYEMLPSGVLELKDEPKADLDAAWKKDPDAEVIAKNIARKRAQRRTKPLEQFEIDQAQQRWRPIIAQQKEDLERQGLGDQLYTENLVEKYIRDDHDQRKLETIN